MSLLLRVDFAFLDFPKFKSHTTEHHLYVLRLGRGKRVASLLIRFCVSAGPKSPRPLSPPLSPPLRRSVSSPVPSSSFGAAAASASSSHSSDAPPLMVSPHASGIVVSPLSSGVAPASGSRDCSEHNDTSRLRNVHFIFLAKLSEGFLSRFLDTPALPTKPLHPNSTQVGELKILEPKDVVLDRSLF
jgi:hypothetical protein